MKLKIPGSLMTLKVLCDNSSAVPVNQLSRGAVKFVNNGNNPGNETWGPEPESEDPPHCTLSPAPISRHSPHQVSLRA